ncbi:ABC-F family ATP-binding cassette domain-containing protein [Nonomuraea sp. NPDC050383]|uniref:ABC-F family ATP-binding cassette domain-containing protein n=1 Tax=Nonomuraea sp. NPDC050383 TaxID=3364362 RepID=UPI0037A8BDD2
MSMSVRRGERLGIVGENGSGKSTLLRLLSGAERPDSGEVVVSGEVGHLGQTLGLSSDLTVQQAVDAALAGLRAMERRLRELESTLAAEPAEGYDASLEEYGDLLTAFASRGGYEADARVDKSLHALGLPHLTAERPSARTRRGEAGGRERTLGSLSGGEQARLGLACVLAASPETLLLDEPTNHLDESALVWLEERLRGHPGTVVVVAHDRIFLDRVTTAVIEVEGGEVTRYGGGYAGFLAAKAAARARWEQAYTAWREEVRQVRDHAATTARRVAQGRVMRDNNKMAYDRNAGRVQSSIAGRVRNAQERLRRLEEHPVPRPPAPLRFRGTFTAPTPADPAPTPAEPAPTPAEPAPGAVEAAPSAVEAACGPAEADGVPPRSPRRVVAELRDVRVGDRLSVESLVIRAGDRLLVHGHNGAGKSTLLRAVAERARGRVGHLAQETVLDPALPVLEAYGHGHPDERRTALLATGLFRAETLDLRVGALSVGQRRRLALARLLAEEHDVLLLDEPTNHLSPELAEELEQALDRFTGTLVVVTHDRALHRRFRGTRLEVSGGHLCH